MLARHSFYLHISASAMQLANINKTLTFHEQIKNTHPILYTQQSNQTKQYKIEKNQKGCNHYGKYKQHI